MSKAIRSLAWLGFVLVLCTPVGASAGTPIDPNLGDSVFGITGGVRYASESTTFDAGNGYGNTEVGCGGPEWRLLGGGSASAGPVAQSWQTAARPDDFNDARPARGRRLVHQRARGGSGRVHGLLDLRPRRRPPLPDDDGGEFDLEPAKWDRRLRCAHVACRDGGVFIATSGSWVNSSAPMDGGDPTATPDNGWAGTVYDSIGGGGGFYVHAVCARGVTLRYVKLPPFKVPTGAAVVRTVACRPAEHVVGGGARVTGSANRARLISTFPYDGKDADGIPDDGWQSRVYGISGAQKKVTAFAICLG